MKRKREEEPKTKINYFFQTLNSNPELIILIFNHFRQPMDLLNIYRVLYHHLNNKEILKYMEFYLTKDPENKYPDSIKKIKGMYNYFLNMKKEKYDKKYFEDNLPTYINKLKKYEEFGTVKIFIKYGICVVCSHFPDMVHEVRIVDNFITNELETKYIYMCNECNTKKYLILMKQSKNFNEGIGKNNTMRSDEDKESAYIVSKRHRMIGKQIVYTYFAENHGIRYATTKDKLYDVKQCHFHWDDVVNYKDRLKLI